MEQKEIRYVGYHFVISKNGNIFLDKDIDSLKFVDVGTTFKLVQKNNNLIFKKIKNGKCKTERN